MTFIPGNFQHSGLKTGGYCHFVQAGLLKKPSYSLTFERETSLVAGKVLLENAIAWLDLPPSGLCHHVYSIPPASKPAGYTHRLRVLLGSLSRSALEGELDSPHTYQGIRPKMSSELGAAWTSCSSLKGCHCGHPRLEAQTAKSHRPGRIKRLFTSPSTGSMRFRRTTRYHTSSFCDMTQINLYAPGPMATMPSLYYGMRDETGSNYICAGSSWD